MDKMDEEKLEAQEVKEIEETSSTEKKNVFSRFIDKRAKKKEQKRKELEETEAARSPEEKEEINEKIEEANKEAKKFNSKKQKIINICFLFLNIALVVAILLWNLLGSDEGITPISSLTINGWAFFLYLFLTFMMIFLDVMSVHRMIYRKTYRSRWPLSYKSLALLRYYDDVTPLAAGGQAFMATYLTGRDVPGSTSLSIPMAKLVFQQISWITICGVCLISSQFIPTITSNTFVTVMSIIGFVLGFCMQAFIIFISVSKNVGRKLVAWCVKLLHKMHLIKNYEKKYESVMKFVDDYQNIMREYGKSVGEVIYQIAIHAIRQIVIYSIPFFIYCVFMGFPATGGWQIYTELFISAALIELSSSFFPLPAGTGMNEVTFQMIFMAYLGDQTFWALLLWRFATFYLNLIQGICIITYDTLYGNRKYRWIKKRLALQEESQIFKQHQIDLFRAERNKRRKREKTLKITNK